MRALADKGGIKELHENFEKAKNTVDADFLKTRDLIQRILQQINEKENSTVDKLREIGVEKLRNHD